MKVEVKGRIARRGQPLKFYCETPVPMNLHGNSPSRRDVHIARELTRLRLMSAEDGERNLVEGAVERVSIRDRSAQVRSAHWLRSRREYIKSNVRCSFMSILFPIINYIDNDVIAVSPVPYRQLTAISLAAYFIITNMTMKKLNCNRLHLQDQWWSLKSQILIIFHYYTIKIYRCPEGQISFDEK